MRTKPKPRPRTRTKRYGFIFVGKLPIKPWAAIYLNGRRIGGTPLYRYKVPVGTHNVQVRWGKVVKARRVTVKAGVQTKVVFSE
jgi:hypothetical protein